MMPRVWLFHATVLQFYSMEAEPLSTSPFISQLLSWWYPSLSQVHRNTGAHVPPSLALALFTPGKTCLGDPITNCQGRQNAISNSYSNVSHVSTISGFLTLPITSMFWIEKHRGTQKLVHYFIKCKKEIFRSLIHTSTNPWNTSSMHKQLIFLTYKKKRLNTPGVRR